MVMAGLVLCIATALCVSVKIWKARQRKVAQRQSFALQQAEEAAARAQAERDGRIHVDTKHYDSHPEMIRQAIDAIAGDKSPEGVGCHYCSAAKLKLLEEGGMRIDEQGKGGGGLYFFDKGPDVHGCVG